MGFWGTLPAGPLPPADVLDKQHKAGTLPPGILPPLPFLRASYEPKKERIPDYEVGYVNGPLYEVQMTGWKE